MKPAKTKLIRRFYKLSKTAIIYWSGTGNTESMATAILEGAKEVNPDTKFFAVSEISAADFRMPGNGGRGFGGR